MIDFIMLFVFTVSFLYYALLLKTIRQNVFLFYVSCIFLYAGGAWLILLVYRSGLENAFFWKIAITIFYIGSILRTHLYFKRVGLLNLHLKKKICSIAQRIANK